MNKWNQILKISMKLIEAGTRKNYCDFLNIFKCDNRLKYSNIILRNLSYFFFKLEFYPRHLSRCFYNNLRLVGDSSYEELYSEIKTKCII